MTEYEIIDAFISIRTEAAGHVMNFVSVLFAYIVAAYLVGSKMSPSQASMITILYVLWSPAPMMAVYDGTFALRDLYINYQDVLSIELGASPLVTTAPMLVTGGMIFGWLVSIVFMFQVRATSKRNVG